MKLPVISGTDLIKMLEKICFKPKRQKGSHVMLVHLDPPIRKIVVPKHAGLKRGTLSGILKQAGLSREDFLDLYHHQHQRSQDGRGCG